MTIAAASAFVVIATPLFAGAFKFWQYVDIKRSEQKQIKFKNYHQLVERLAVPPEGHANSFIDVQKAAIFELRNYPEYKKVTRSIFLDWKERSPRLKDLIKDTLKELDEK